MALIPGTKLRKGKVYRLVEAVASAGFVGLVFRVTSNSRLCSDSSIPCVQVLTLYEGIARSAVDVWWMYKEDLFEELSEEEAMLYAIQGEA